MGRILNVDILNRLERMLHMVGSPSIRDAQPGLALDELRLLGATFPARLPDEAELWWSWRTLGSQAEGDRFLPDTQWLPLNECMAEYEMRREWAREHGVSAHTSEVTPDDWWHPLWLPIFVEDSGIVLVIDGSTSNATSGSIRRIDWQSFGGEYFESEIAPSLGCYITDMLDAIDAGDYTYDQATHLWFERPSS